MEKTAHQDDLDKAIEAMSNGLDAIARVQGLIQIDNVYREMHEFLHDLRLVRDRMLVGGKHFDSSKRIL